MECISQARFKLGEKVHVRSIISPSERIEYNKTIVQVPLVLNGIITYIHPEGRFINVNNGRYTESYLPQQVSAGWAKPNLKDTGGQVKILEYAGRNPD